MSRKCFLCLAGTAVALAALPARAAGPVELVAWHAYRGDEKTAFEKVVADYNQAAAAKGIKVTTLAVPYDAFADKITAAVPRGKGPDMFIYAQDRLGGWVEAGNTIESIDFYVDEATRKRFLPTALQAMTYQGTLYGLPLNFKVITMVYNTKLLTTPPRTSGELVVTAKKLTDAAIGKFGLAYWYSNFYYHAPLMNAFGGGVFGPDGKPVLDSPANIKSLDLLLKWIKAGILPAEPSTALVTTLFNEGKAAIVFSGPWFLGEIAKGIDYKLAPLPTIDEAGGAPMKPWMTVEGVFIAAGCKHPEEAYDFVKYVTGTGAGEVLALQGRQTPANLDVYKNEQVATDPILAEFRKQVEVAIPMPNRLEMTMVWSPVTTAMNTIVQGSATPAAAMAEAQKQVLAAIARLHKEQ
jgi:arabinogalactan oligomer/maltooligosaccharide transport system substrate-binding protein